MEMETGMRQDEYDIAKIVTFQKVMFLLISNSLFYHFRKSSFPPFACFQHHTADAGWGSVLPSEAVGRRV